MKTMTKAELNRAIYSLRGFRLFSDDEMRAEVEKVWETQPYCAEFIEFRATRDSDGQIKCKQHVPNYCGDINIAIKLFRGLPNPTLRVNGKKEPEDAEPCVRVSWYREGEISEIQYVYAPKEREAEAIAKAWYQWQTGEEVEVND